MRAIAVPTSISAKPDWCWATLPPPSRTSRIWKTSASSAARSRPTSSGRSRGIRGWWLVEECSAAGAVSIHRRRIFSSVVTSLKQLKRLQARVADLADDEMVVHGDAERARDLDDRPRHVDVGARGGGIAGGMVVDQDHGGGGEFERALDHLARIDRGVIDGAGLMLLVGDQGGTLVEEQNSEVLLALEGHGGPTIVQHVRPRRQHLALFDLAAHEAIGCRLHDLEFGDGGLSQTVHLGHSFRRRRDHFREGADPRDQALRDRL